MFGLDKYGGGIGLHRIYRFCDIHSIDMEYLSDVSVVVTGSKGKGSTARFIYQTLCDSIHEVGCFTSPHLIDVAERYEFAGRRITNDVFNHYKAQVLTFSEQLRSAGDSLGEFELLFLVALKWYSDLRPRAIVWEAGIGGRYDPVRTLRAPLSVLTSVELEHTELLGNSPELIAYDKLDAIRPQGRAFISPSVSPTLRERLAAFGAAAMKNISFVSDEMSIQDVRTSCAATKFVLAENSGRHYEAQIPLVGEHQVRNAVTALVASREFLKLHGIANSLEQLAPALSRTTWPGRLERISVSPDVWIDVGHTPDSVRTVCDEFLRIYHKKDVIAVFGVSYNKLVKEIASIVEERFDTVVLARAKKNGLDIAALKNEFLHARPQIVDGCEGMSDLVAQVRELAVGSGKTVIVIGGLFLAVEFAHAWRGRDPAELNFF